MSGTFALFATAPIGAGHAALDGGLTATTTADGNTDPVGAVRSDVARSSGVAGAEFSAWGDGDQRMVVGILEAAVDLDQAVGADAASVGWRLDTGEILVGGAAVASGIDPVDKGAIVGVWIDVGAGTVKFYLGDTQVHSRALPAGADWHFGVSLASDVAGELACAVNAGQWIPAGPAAAAGWLEDAAAPITLQLADVDYLTATTDTPANSRYEGIVDGAGVDTYKAIYFWPWGGDAPQQGGNAQVTLLDPDGMLDAIAPEDLDSAAVSVHLAPQPGTLAEADQVARYLVDQLEHVDDVRKVLHLRSASAALDKPLTRLQFLPNIPALAWRPVPVVIGAVASVPALAGVADGSVAFLCDAPLLGCDAVLDRGDPLEDADWSLDPSGQQLLLADPPAGPVVADVSTEGFDMQPAPLQATLRAIFDRAGIRSWVPSEAAAIDTATGYAGIGFYDATGMTCGAALAKILPSYGAWPYEGSDGTIHIVRAIAPETAGSVAWERQAVDLEGDLGIGADRAPNLSRRMAFRPNAYVHGAADLVTDLVDVPPARRLELTSPYRGQVYSTVRLAACYAAADAAAPLVSCFYSGADAQAELDRVCGMYQVRRRFFVWTERASDWDPQPGEVGRITYPRYGLEAGLKVLVRSVQRNPVTGDVTAMLWG